MIFKRRHEMKDTGEASNLQQAVVVVIIIIIVHASHVFKQLSVASARAKMGYSINKQPNNQSNAKRENHQ